MKLVPPLKHFYYYHKAFFIIFFFFTNLLYIFYSNNIFLCYWCTFLVCCHVWGWIPSIHDLYPLFTRTAGKLNPIPGGKRGSPWAVLPISNVTCSLHTERQSRQPAGSNPECVRDKDFTTVLPRISIKGFIFTTSWTIKIWIWIHKWFVIFTFYFPPCLHTQPEVFSIHYTH